MLELINLSVVPIYLLIFARMIAFFVALPLFSYRTIPMMFKIGLAIFLSLIVFTIVDHSTISLEQYPYVILLIKEVFIGLMIGLIAYIILTAVQIAGGFIDFQMGFAIANVIDPQTGAQSPLIGQYFYIFALLFLLSVNGHHLLIDGMINSFNLLKIDELIPLKDVPLGDYIINHFNQMFIVAFQMAIPLVGCLFLVDVALGIIARTVPQVNVFVVGLPLKITVSFTVLLFFLSLYIVLVRYLFESMFEAMHGLIRLFGGA